MSAKLFIVPIFCLLLLIIPLLLWAQFDNFWIPDDMLIENTEGSIEPEINLQTLDLYWSADTYVPFGYEGRALPTQESLIIVNADLKIAGGDPKNLKYSWFLDGIFQEAKSGYGRDSLKLGVRRTSGASHTVLLKIFNESRSFYVEKSINIPIVNPEIVVYNKTNAKKMILPYLVSAKDFDVVSDEENAFLALPYFFSIKKIKDLDFEWKLGEKSVKDSLTANVIGLKIVNKEVGGMLKEILKLNVINRLFSKQRAKKTINLNIY